MDRCRRHGRPRGTTAQGLETRRRLYETAIGLIAARGWQETTLRDVAAEAGVSVGLLYRYFPSKQAIVLTLYDELSAEYAARAAQMGPGRWRDRFFYALRTSLEVLRPHRRTLASLVPVLIGDSDEGLFAPRTAFSRLRVQGVFVQAAAGASDAPTTACTNTACTRSRENAILGAKTPSSASPTSTPTSDASVPRCGRSTSRLVFSAVRKRSRQRPGTISAARAAYSAESSS